jgi:hypothetical protein
MLFQRNHVPGWITTACYGDVCGNHIPDSSGSIARREDGVSGFLQH